MKKILSLAVFFGALVSASAGTMTVYEEDWGNANTSVHGNGNIDLVGWTGVAPSQPNGPPYLGIYAASGPTDPTSGTALPVNTVYFTDFPNSSPGMFYTTETSGTGSGGDTSFPSGGINPTLYTNLAFNVEVTGQSTLVTNYFAVEVGGQWYAATSFIFPNNPTVTYPDFTNVTLIYTNPANVWQNLTINSTSVTIGSVASPSLTSTIQGVGIVEITSPSTGFNYNELTITAYSPSGPAATPASITSPAVTPQYSYVGGGASFLVEAAGTPPLAYIWETNNVPIGNDPRFLGTTSNELTISNLNLNDGNAAYSVIVTNIAGAATNTGMTVSVSSVPSGLLYAEDFPYVGPSGENDSISGVGWVVSASDTSTYGIYQVGDGNGDAYAYSPSVTTNAFYTTDTNDAGLSGLPFVDINPADYPAITFQAGFDLSSGSVSVYWAVAMNGTWYCSAQPQAISGQNSFQTYQYGFNPAAANWDTLTITGTNAVIGSGAPTSLTGDITGAGLVFAHNSSSGSDMNYQDFEIITNAYAGVAPVIGTNFPLSVGVASGGGASFGVSTVSGTPPFGYYWETNGVVIQDGPDVFGANTPTLTLANLNAGDNGMVIVAYVTNSAGYDYSDSTYSLGAAVLTVTNAPVGYIYSEECPFVGPVGGDYPISSVGWVEAVPDAPNALYQITQYSSQGAIFAYYGSPATTVYYVTTATSTNQSGLPFPNINLDYPHLTFSVDIAPYNQSSNVTAYLAVQLNNTSWYVSASALPVPTSVDSSTFSTYTTAFNPAAANWNNLIVTSSGGLVGSPATAKLRGVMTGAGLVFVTVGTGGTFDFANFVITGTGPGGINVGPPSDGTMNLTWVGNPAVELQSSTNLESSWQSLTNTYGLYSFPASVTGSQKYFRLKTP